MPGTGLPLWLWLLLALSGLVVTVLLVVALWRVARAQREITRALREQATPPLAPMRSSDEGAQGIERA